MKERCMKFTFMVSILMVALLSFTCSRRSPSSPDMEEPTGGRGLLKLELQLSKGSGQTVDKVVVVAERVQTESVTGELAIRGTKATGSLEVPPGKGWVITAQAYIGEIVYYEGQSQSVDVEAGQTVSVSIVAYNLTPRITILKPDGTATADESYVIAWEDQDRDSDAVISLFYDNDNVGTNGTPIPGAARLSENDPRNAFTWNLSTLPEGRYYVYAKIDDGEHPPKYEYSPGVVIVSHAKANLAAERVYLTKRGETAAIDLSKLVEGDQIDLNLAYKNTGSVAAAGWRVEAYVDGALVGSNSGLSIAANSAGTWRIPWTATVGTHAIEFRLDPGDLVREGDETDNTAALTFTVSARPKADLLIQEVLVNDGEGGTIYAGEQVSVRLTYRNAGSVAAAGWRVEAYVDGTLVGSKDGLAVNPNADGEWEITWEAITGTHVVAFKLDTGNVIPEIDEGNNMGSLTFTVSVRPKADLLIQEVLVNDGEGGTIYAGEQVSVRLTYRNAGSVAATGWRVEAYVDGTLVGSKDGLAVNPNADGEWEITWEAITGTHVVAFKLDTGNVIPEIDENNNLYSLTLPVEKNPWLDTDGDGFLDSEDLFPEGNAKIQVVLQYLTVFASNGWGRNEIYFLIRVDRLPDSEEIDLWAPSSGHWWSIGEGESRFISWSGVVDVADNEQYHTIIIQVWEYDIGLTGGDDIYDLDGSNDTFGLTLQYDLKSQTFSGDDNDGIVDGRDDNIIGEPDVYLEYEIKTVLE